jgi:hypothetical protein
MSAVLLEEKDVRLVTRGVPSLIMLSKFPHILQALCYTSSTSVIKNQKEI